MNKWNVLVTLVLVSMMGFGFYQIQLLKQKNKVVFVETLKVFEAFEFKNEMQKKFDHETKSVSKHLDSLAFEIQVNSKDLGEDNEEQLKKVEQLKAEYYQRRTNFENYSVELTREYDNQILTQMKQYLSDFADKEGYDFILGKTDDALMLYGTDAMDVTQEAILFINSKYQGN